MSERETNQAIRRLLRGNDLFNNAGQTGLLNISKSQFYDKVVNDPEFPQAVSIGERAVAWYSDEVEKWINSRQRAAVVKAKFSDDVRKGFAMSNATHRLAKVEQVNADGKPTKPTVPAVINRTDPANITTASPIANGPDASRVRAAKPKSDDHEGNFVPVANIEGIVGLRPGELEHLQGHGIRVGIVDGVLSIQRKYVPAAQGLIQQARGR